MVKQEHGEVLEFINLEQWAEMPFSEQLDSAEAVTIGGWFFPRRTGEQYFLRRGTPEIGQQGERFFRPEANWVNFVLGTDEHGFLLGTINGNGAMPFVHVTISQVPFNAWSQLVVVKDSRGVHKFYHNGVLVHTDDRATSGARARAFRDTDPGQPVRLAVQQGGLIGEAWVYRQELSAEDIARDFEVKKSKYRPAHQVQRVWLRDLDAHQSAHLWPAAVTRESWPEQRRGIEMAARSILGGPQGNKVPLEPQTISETDCGSYWRRKVSYQVQPGDRAPAYLLIPKNLQKPAPAVLCFYGTTSGAGKDTAVGLSGLKPGTPPLRNFAFAIDMVEGGFVALAPDYLRDGERVAPNRRPYDTTDFYESFPEWSIHGKDVWDTSRAIDYLETLEFVDSGKIGMTGHSYGGHSTIFTTALEPRIKVAVANGPVSDFLHHGLHWGVPKGAGNSQSLPALRPYVLDHTLPLPLTFYEFTALIAPRPLLIGQAVGERRPMEEENCAAVRQVYDALGQPDKVRYVWYAGDHDYPPEMRRAAVDWFRKWFAEPQR